MTEPLTYESEALIRQWRERFTGRRTIAHEMLEQAEVLVREAVARELSITRHQAKTEREWDLERRERVVELKEGSKDWQADRLRRQLAEAEQKLMQLSPRQTLMREERETVEDGTVIRLLAPTVPSYGNKNSPRPWMLGELEDVIHRLRMGGAEDSTELRFKHDAIEACVPFAEFALAPAPPGAALKAPLPNPVVKAGQLAIRGRALFALSAVVSFVIAFALTVVFR